MPRLDKLIQRADSILGLDLDSLYAEEGTVKTPAYIHAVFWLGGRACLAK